MSPFDAIWFGRPHDHVAGRRCRAVVERLVVEHRVHPGRDERADDAAHESGDEHVGARRAVGRGVGRRPRRQGGAGDAGSRRAPAGVGATNGRRDGPRVGHRCGGSGRAVDDRRSARRRSVGSSASGSVAVALADADRANRTRESFHGPRGAINGALSPTSPPAEMVPGARAWGVLFSRHELCQATPWEPEPIPRPLYWATDPLEHWGATDGRHDPSRPHRAGMDAPGAVPLSGARRVLPSDGVGVDKARKICDRVPVKPECLEYALTYRIDHGVWGGASERERRRILRRRRVDGSPVPGRSQPASVKVV